MATSTITGSPRRASVSACSSAGRHAASLGIATYAQLVARASASTEYGCSSEQVARLSMVFWNWAICASSPSRSTQTTTPAR